MRISLFKKLVTNPICGHIIKKYDAYDSADQEFSSIHANTAYLRFKLNQLGNTVPNKEALLREKSAKVNEALDLFSKKHQEEYIQMLIAWNTSLGSPLHCFNWKDLTVVQLLDIEKRLLSVQLTKSTHTISPEVYEFSKDKLKSNSPQPCTFHGPITGKLEEDQVTAGAALAMTLGLYVVPLCHYTSVNGWAIAASAIFPMLGFVFGIQFCTYSLLSGKAMTTRIRSRLSKTWEEVFQERSIEDAMLVGMICQFFNTNLHIAQHKKIDLTALTPSQAYDICKYKNSSVTELCNNDQLVSRYDEPASSFSMAPYVPVKVPTTNLEYVHAEMLNLLSKNTTNT